MKSDFAYIKALDQSLHDAFQNTWEKSQKKGARNVYSVQRHPFCADAMIAFLS